MRMMETAADKRRQNWASGNIDGVMNIFQIQKQLNDDEPKEKWILWWVCWHEQICFPHR